VELERRENIPFGGSDLGRKGVGESFPGAAQGELAPTCSSHFSSPFAKLRVGPCTLAQPTFSFPSLFFFFFEAGFLYVTQTGL
jgi:hypothetical protein